MKLTSTARKGTTVGEIVNLMSVDAQKLHDTCINLHESWASLVTVVICIILLWNVIGELDGNISGCVFLKHVLEKHAKTCDI